MGEINDKKMFELIASVLVTFIFTGKVLPKDIYKLSRIAEGDWSEVE